MRPTLGDAAKLSWEALDLERKVIVHVPQKAVRAKKRKHKAIILRSLEEVAFPVAGGERQPKLAAISDLVELRTGGCNGLSARFRKIMTRAEIDKGEHERNVTGKGRRFFQLGFHSLRHTFISLMANLGVRREVRMKLAGHSTAVHDRYSHLELETFRRELSGFPDLALEPES